MTPPYDDHDHDQGDDAFVEQLRASLDHRADDVTHVDLGQPALRQARRIRTRRRVGAGVVAAAAVLVVPAAVTLLDDGSSPRDQTADRGTTEVDVGIVGLEQGAPPSVPFVDGTTFVGPDGDVTDIAAPVDQPDRPVIDAVQLADGVAVWESDADGNLQVRAADGSTYLPSGPATQPVVDGTGELAYSVVAGGGQGDLVVVADSVANDVTSGPVGAKVNAVIGLDGGTILLNTESAKSRSVVATTRDALADSATGGTAGAPDFEWAGATYLTAADHDLAQVTGHTTDMTGRDADCSALYDVEEGAEQWRTCEWRPVEFSADGSMVLALPAMADGFGPRGMAVLDSTTGETITKLTTEGTFGRATFEGDDSVLTVVVVGNRSAIVRCPVDGETCELATEPAKVASGDPDSLISPYQLTAN